MAVTELAADTAESIEAVPTERLEADVQTLAGHLAAATCRWLLMIAELDRREAWRSWEVASMAHWLSWKCGVSLVTGRDHVRVARALEELPLVRERFERGQLSYSKARALCRLVSMPEMEADLVELAEVATAAQLDRITAGYRRAQRFADPERDRRNHEQRRWRVTIDDDGAGTFTVRAPADVLATITKAVDVALLREVPVEAGEMAARRVDALEAIAQHYMQPDATEPVATTMIVRDDNCSTDNANRDSCGTPTRLNGLPITRTAYERLRCDAATAVERTLADGSVERTPLSAAIPRRIRRAVRKRDMHTCRWPSCTNTVHLHVHHIVFRSHRGRHTISNLVLLCAHHHRVVHLGLYELTGDANGRLRIVGRDGRELWEVEPPRPPTSPAAVAIAHRKAGLEVSDRTISGAYNEPLRLAWTVGAICDLESVRRRRH